MRKTRRVKPQIIDDAPTLAEVCTQLRAAGSFAFDTEFVGEEKYQPEICLIQAATDSRCVLIDPLGGLDLSPFWRLLTEPAVQAVVHAGTEDLALCWKQVGKCPANVFDIQIAAGFVGLGYPISLSRLAKMTIGATIHKAHTLSDWRRRPLSEDQISYAVEDVVHLPRIAQVLQKRLRELGRLEWAVEECASMCAPEVFAPPAADKLLRLRGCNSLSRRQLAVLARLLEERDALAMEYNRPARGVVKDHLLVEMARRGWTDVHQLRSLRGLSLSAAALRRLAGVIDKAKQIAPEAMPELARDPDSPEEEALVSLISLVLRDHCERSSLAYGLVANKDDLRGFVRAYTRPNAEPPQSALRAGWRAAAIGDLLERLMAGQYAIRVGDKDGGYRLRVE